VAQPLHATDERPSLGSAATALSTKTMTRKTATLTIVTFRVVEESDDDETQPPSLPPFPIDVEGQTVSETIRPLAKVLPFASKLRRLA